MNSLWSPVEIIANECGMNNLLPPSVCPPSHFLPSSPPALIQRPLSLSVSRLVRIPPGVLKPRVETRFAAPPCGEQGGTSKEYTHGGTPYNAMKKLLKKRLVFWYGNMYVCWIDSRHSFTSTLARWGLFKVCIARKLFCYLCRFHVRNEKQYFPFLLATIPKYFRKKKYIYI